LRFRIGHFHDISATAAGIGAVCDRAGFLYLNFRATLLINAAPYLTAFQSHRLLFCGSVVVWQRTYMPWQILLQGRFTAAQKRYMVSITSRIDRDMATSLFTELGLVCGIVTD
jgi:hypothetical protein